MPSQEQSYAGRDAGIYFFKPADDLSVSECGQLEKQGYKYYFAKADEHIYILLLKVKT